MVPACRSLDCVSIFALTVEDAVQVASLMAGFDGEDPYSRSAPASFDLRSPAWTGNFRVGVPRRSRRVVFGDIEAERLFESDVDRAVEAGGRIVEIDFAPWVDTANLLYGPWTAERAAAIEDMLLARPEALHPVTRTVIERGLAVSAVEAFRAQYRMAALAQEIHAVARKVYRLPFALGLVPTTRDATSRANLVRPSHRLLLSCGANQ